MQVETLKVFCDVVRLRSFSRGAEANGVLQSAASQAVTQLEKRLGVALIDRSHRPWDLTTQGKTFYEGCRDVLDRYVTLENEIRQVQEQANAVVRVAAIYSIGLRNMNQFIQQFAAQRPGARVEMEYLHPDRVYEHVRHDEVDFGIVSFPHKQGEMAVIPWRDEPMVVVCHPTHRFAARQRLAPAVLDSERFVAFDRGLEIRRQVDRFLKRHQAKVNVVAEFDNIEAIKRAVEAATGVAVLPEPSLEREVESGTLEVVPFDGAEFVRPVSLIHRRGRKLLPNTKQFIDLLLHEGNGAA